MWLLPDLGQYLSQSISQSFTQSFTQSLLLTFVFASLTTVFSNLAIHRRPNLASFHLSVCKHTAPISLQTLPHRQVAPTESASLWDSSNRFLLSTIFHLVTYSLPIHFPAPFQLDSFQPSSLPPSTLPIGSFPIGSLPIDSLPSFQSTSFHLSNSPPSNLPVDLPTLPVHLPLIFQLTLPINLLPLVRSVFLPPAHSLASTGSYLLPGKSHLTSTTLLSKVSLPVRLQSCFSPLPPHHWLYTTSPNVLY